MNNEIVNQINWEKVGGLVPAIIQDNETGQVLMLGYMNLEALQQTLESDKVTFFSRTKNRLWVKGETSDNFLILKDLTYDCDNDALLVLARPMGPTCHKGTTTCFKKNYESPWHTVQYLENTINQRKREMPEGSYVTSLFKEGINRISQKVGEEAVESVIASVSNNDEELRNELADMFFHTLVLLEAKDIKFSDVLSVLDDRKK
jgi:phosphoribosyl-ATP pyrophosphohydrolase/phosphoribosyl-AMP cyclohydrolase